MGTSIAVDGSDDTGAKKPVVCFLGPMSSYTHQAALQSFSKDDVELMPVSTIKDVFETTQAGAADYGVVPIENSTHGSVVFTLDLFAECEKLYPDLSVCAEVYLKVHHCLLGYLPPPAAASLPTTTTPTASSLLVSGQCTPTPSHPQPIHPRAQPLVSLAHIKRIYSHPQAFGQCRKFFETYLRGADTVDVSSTSRAAELAASDPSGESAAVSSALAATETGLEFLGRNIEDRDDNETRFFVLWRDEGALVKGRGQQQSIKSSSGAKSQDNHASGATKSLVSFTVPHRAPGALADVLECFRKGGLDLTSINSRPSLIAPFQYIFFVEFEGHKLEDPQGRVKDVLENVGNVAESWRWLGSWENMRR
ncbi:Prephenate dehydratase-domain-containing protein [Pseudomassariella vexata]|uniref:prephenate dehydratase n=1 Tax=Pseudomassariella vexata TaxID=1141098 RepID=A0A1Y2EEI4_9PEZI|nr:Prephenate dehydratase-domain-containing protein [Pseudomassariella vexata]ORY69969.1 Prephenate dehydratase-domain-containing protein [Pseudomassariella vexata]